MTKVFDSEITPDRLQESGYHIYGPSSLEQPASRAFQKCFTDNAGKQYFVTFYEYDFSMYRERNYTGPDFAYNAKINIDTDSNGYLWITVREDTIALTEERAKQIWKAVGSCYYEKSLLSVDEETK